MSRSCTAAMAIGLLVSAAVWVGGSARESASKPIASTINMAFTESRVVAPETRTFQVSVDGVPRGTLTMRFTVQADGTETMSARAELNFNFLVYQYHYESSGTETWKSGRLVQLANEADFNGEKYVVQASANQQELAFEVNGSSQRTEPDVWVTSYWHEPEPHKVGETVSLLEASKGRQLSGTLQCIGTESINVGEQSMTATHYQIRGDVEVDLWYDGDHRLIRQAARESGHRVVLELTSVTR